MARFRRLWGLSLVGAVLLVAAAPAPNPDALRAERRPIGDRLEQDRRGGARNTGESHRIAGLEVTVWRPAAAAPAGGFPVVVFSHGFHGSSQQSTFLMAALARGGYLVVAPNHGDAARGGGGRPEAPFARADAWSDATYRDRADDVARLVKSLQTEEPWRGAIDASRIALAGHSLGGYTVLGLAGGWPSWKLPSVKAVLALSPYSAPLVRSGKLGSMGVPVMYQGGTRDVGITPFVNKGGGAYDRTASPAYYVEFDRAGHFAWTDLVAEFQPSIEYYCMAFLDKHLKGAAGADPGRRRADVSDLRSK